MKITDDEVDRIKRMPMPDGVRHMMETYRLTKDEAEEWYFSFRSSGPAVKRVTGPASKYDKYD